MHGGGRLYPPSFTMFEAHRRFSTSYSESETRRPLSLLEQVRHVLVIARHKAYLPK